MKKTRFLLTFALLLTVGVVAYAQSDMSIPHDMLNPSSQVLPNDVEMSNRYSATSSASLSTMKASVELGPVLQIGGLPSADVFVGNKLALRIASSAGGYDPLQRATIISDRINSAFAQGYSWHDISVSQVGQEWTVGVGGNLIATADTNSAAALGTTSAKLASSWGNDTVIALGGDPDSISNQLTPSLVAGSMQVLPATGPATAASTPPVLNMPGSSGSASMTPEPTIPPQVTPSTSSAPDNSSSCASPAPASSPGGSGSSGSGMSTTPEENSPTVLPPDEFPSPGGSGSSGSGMSTTPEENSPTVLPPDEFPSPGGTGSSGSGAVPTPGTSMPDFENGPGRNF